MKKITFLFALLCASVMGWATQYCGVTSSNANFTFSIMNVSGNTYRIQFDAVGDIKFGGAAVNVNCGVNQSGGAGIYFGGDNAANWVFTDDRAYLEFTTASGTSVPTGFYGNYFCFSKKGGDIIVIENFNPSDVDWSATCAPAVVDTEKPVMTSATCSSTTHNSATIAVAATDNVGVTKYIVKNGGSELGEYTPSAGVIVVEDLAASTNYTLTVFAKDAAGNVSASGIDVACNTSAAPTNPYCNLEIGHMANPSADVNSFILLSVGSDGNGHTIVNIKQDNAKNSAMFDYINIVGKKEIGSDVATGGSDEMAIVFNTPTPDGDGNITFTLQWSTINWGGRWQIDNITVPATAICASADPFPGTNAYCKYTDNQMRSGNANVALTWSTDASGNVVIDISDGDGATNSAFRNGGFENEGTFANTWKVYSGTNHSIVESGDVYFNAGVLSNGNKRFTLTKKTDLPANAVVAFFGHAFSWRTDQATGAYELNKWFGYDYGYSCPFLAAPTNVAVDGTKHITFDAVANAETYTAYVYLNEILKHRQVVNSGDELTFQPYTTGTYQVQVVADASGYPTSDPSEAYDWALTAPAIVVGNSEYCESAIGSGNQAAAITWETNDDGNIVITLKETLGGGEDDTQFRGTNGMALANFQVGEARTAAGAYFNHTKSGKTITLSLKNSSIKPGLGEKIYYTDKVVEYVTSQNNNAYGNMTFVYTYGAKCSGQKHVSVAVNDNAMGSATVNGEAAVDVDPGTQVTCVATPAEGYEFVNWTIGGVEVATTATYQPTITAATSLVANFDYSRTTYCHTAVQTSGNKKVYLTVGKGATEGTYQIKIYGSDELTITGINNANTAINHVKYLTYDGNDVPLTIDNGGWTYSSEGYGVITSAELRPQTNHTWRDMWMWRPDLYIGTSAGEQNINAVLNQQNHFNWNSTCSDAEAPVINKAEAEVLNETSVQLKIQATDNWGGLLTYTIAREAAEPIISNHASGEEFTQDVTGLTTGTEYTFTVTVSDGVNNANQNIVVTPVGDSEKPVMSEASLESKTWNSAIINVAATDNKGVTAYYVVEKDADYVATEGKITIEGLTQATAYTFNIKAKDAAGNISDNATEVSFTTDAHLFAPTTAPAAPTLPAAQVISFYSDAYTAPTTWNYRAGWGGSTAYEQVAIAETNMIHYSNLDYVGWVITAGNPYNALTMEKLHLDIWVENDCVIGIVPIYGGSGLDTDDNKRVKPTLHGQQWNSIDLDLATDYAGLNLSSIFQFKFDQATTNEFYLDNVYFYRTTELVDDDAPYNVTGDMASQSFFSVTLDLSATDDSGAVTYIIKNGDAQVATTSGSSDATVNVKIDNLASGTVYVFSVIAKDGSDNEADAIIVNASTLAAPAPAPTPTEEAVAVKSLFSDAYTPVVNVANYCEWWWESPTVHTNHTLGEGDHVLFYDNNHQDGASFGWSWSAGNKIDFSGYQKLHMHIYPTTSGTIEMYPVIAPESEFHKVSQTLTAGQWNEVVLDYTEKTFAPLNQIGFINFYNLGEFFIDNVYFYYDPVEITLSDTEDNAALIAEKDDVYANVRLTRTFPLTTEWYTLCLPFDLSDEQLEEAFGAGYTLATLANSVDHGSLISLNFDFVHSFEAGKAYLLRPGTAVTENPVFEGVVVKNVNPEDVAATSTLMNFQGTYNNIVLDSENQRFVGPENYLYSPAEGGTNMKAFRCFFSIPQNSPLNGAPGRQARIVFGEQTATGMESVQGDDVQSAKVLMDGQLFIIREGRIYNAQGTLVK